MYEWEEFSSDLFKPYIRKAMKLKIESSGWDADVLCPDDEDEEQRRKEEFIRRNEEEYGITLDIDAIFKNPGMRFVAKLICNCFWGNCNVKCMSLRNFVILGRWSLQNNLTQDCITTSPYELHQVLENDKLEKGPVEMLAPDLFAVPYKSKSDFVTSHSKYNIVIALYTTAYARITLYRYMEQIIMAPNYKLLYTGNCRCCLSVESKKICIDTDSVIFLGPRNQPVPFEEGSMLGQMKNEYTDQDIQAFYSGGFVFGACAHIAQIFSHTHIQVQTIRDSVALSSDRKNFTCTKMPRTNSGFIKRG